MEIEFVCHASVVFRRDPIHLMCDPWLVGTAFDDGRTLLGEPVFKAEDFASITHIWFSQEHPDHFSPRTLAMIPAEVRQRITVLFHHSLEAKVAELCRKLGFNELVEFAQGQWLPLAPGFAILCDTWRGPDASWLLLRTPEGIILNLNDCQVARESEIRALRERIGAVDVLLAQFSMSPWHGNAECLTRRQVSEATMQRIVTQAQGLAAKHVIPFASFVYCCHEENFHMNAAMTGVTDLAARLRNEAGVQPVVLYPGEVWSVGATMDPAPAIARYMADLAGLASRPRIPAARDHFAC
jgi:UDP-MurNAc hydroxylase